MKNDVSTNEEHPKCEVEVIKTKKGVPTVIIWKGNRYVLDFQ